MFGQYRGMRRELYILFWGKAATNMGAMIWPMLTLILSNKLEMNAQEIAKITIAMGVVQFPANLLGGKDVYKRQAMAGFADVPGTRIIVFYPKGGVSPVQERQMRTQKGENTACLLYTSRCV